MTLDPGVLRELHWHPDLRLPTPIRGKSNRRASTDTQGAERVAEWLFIHSGEARATAFPGDENHRTSGFHSGDTAVAQ